MTSSIVLPPSVELALRDHQTRLLRIERSDGSNPWIYVANDDTDPLWTPDSPPWQNGWGNAGDGQAPVSFKRFLNWVHIRGAFTGGADNTIVFTLPTTYEPLFPVSSIGGLADGSGVFSYLIDTSGNVTYVTAGTL